MAGICVCFVFLFMGFCAVISLCINVVVLPKKYSIGLQA
jgi:hypothetical protein